MTETSAVNDKKNITKLQRIVVDALEDVKAVDLQVFNTEHLSSLFDRVVIASGTSNRQTRALASSVRDKVREAGFTKPRIEGEDNGEWIVVDCGSVVAHVMQPAIRQYYHLEDIWGDKPVKMMGAAKKAADKSSAPAKKAVLKKKPAVVADSIESVATKTIAIKKPAPAKAAAKKTSAPAKKAAPAKKSVPAKQSASSKKPVAPKKRAAV